MLWACGIGILVAIMGFILSELGFRGKRVFSTLAIVLFLLVFIDLAKDIILELKALPIGEDGVAALSSALKIIGVGHAFGISSDICTELSEVGVASVLLLIGKLEIAIIILPHFKEFIEYSSKILS